MSQLRVTSSILKGGVFDLSGEYFTIGREEDNHIHLDHTSVSKHHAILKIDNGDLKLFDLHSTNGTIVNGEMRVVTHLRDGDKILLGEVELCFEANNKATQPIAPTPLPTPKPVAPSPVKPTVIATPPPVQPEVRPTPVLPREIPKAVTPVEKFTPPAPAKIEPPPSPAPKPVEVAIKPPPPVPVAEAKPVAPAKVPEPVATPKVEPKPAELAVAALDAAATTRRKPGMLAGLMSRLRLSRAAEPVPEPTPMREVIRAELAEKFDSMGLELPNPPPAQQPQSGFGYDTVTVTLHALSNVTPKPKPAEPESTPAPTAGPVSPIPPAPPRPPPERLLRTPTPARLPEPPPAIVMDLQMSRWRLACVMSLLAGALLVGLGYVLGANPLKFFGVLVAMGGLISLIFTLRFGSLVAPPRKKPTGN